MSNYSKVSNKVKKRGYFINKWGAKVYLNSLRQKVLPLHSGENIYTVLNVGFDKSGVSTITIRKNVLTECYRLPIEYNDWVKSLVAMAQVGINMFPCDVKFTIYNGKYFADLL